jgi:hypothetical protein
VDWHIKYQLFLDSDFWAAMKTNARSRCYRREVVKFLCRSARGDAHGSVESLGELVGRTYKAAQSNRSSMNVE